MHGSCVMKRPLTLVIAAATAALAITPLGLGTQTQAQVDVYIGKQKQPQQGQLPPSTGPYGDRDRDNYDNRRGDRYDQYGNRYTPIATAMALPTRGTETTTIRIADSDACGYEKK